MKTKIIIIIFLAAAALTAGTIYYTKEPADDLGPVSVHHELKTQSPATATPQSVVATSPAIDVSGWKTYTNSEYGFGLRYPSEWSVNDPQTYSAQTKPIFWASRKKSIGCQEASCDATDEAGITFFVADDKGDLTEKYVLENFNLSVDGAPALLKVSQNADVPYSAYTIDGNIIINNHDLYILGQWMWSGMVDRNLFNKYNTRQQSINEINEIINSIKLKK